MYERKKKSGSLYPLKPSKRYSWYPTLPFSDTLAIKKEDKNRTTMDPRRGYREQFFLLLLPSRKRIELIRTKIPTRIPKDYNIGFEV